ncbi:unnamed protein product [Pocillopora meandrina]|uniref:Uncharacterized protein n=1 Tax=Pocillopora meandrina TaxID=46732 RepID=A0AAU9XK76_9CNID|nr:unnamed protein product [Pocillopora meandrina]
MWPEVTDELMIYKCGDFHLWIWNEQSYIVSMFLTGKYKSQVMMDNCITSASPGETMMAPCSFTEMEL